MPNHQSVNGTEALGRSKLTATGDDRDLLVLEAQLDNLVVQLLAVQRADGEQISSSDQLPAMPDSSRGGADDGASVGGSQEKNVEAVLARLYPVERAIMAAPAHTIVGLGVKARHAAYVMSQYWEEPTDKIDWEAQTIRLLVEAVCDVAGTPLSFRTGKR